MAVEVAEMAKSGEFTALWSSPEWKSQLEARKAREDEDALAYLRAKFPGVDEKAFFTNYRGKVSQHIAEAGAVIRAATIERTCAQCDGQCTLPDRNGKPIACIGENPGGFKYLEIRWTCGISCRYDPMSGEFGRMYRASGLMSSQFRQTFESYECGTSKELKNAMKTALMSARNQTSLVLGGRAGTGKTHLATAVAIYAMRQGRQAIFRLVNELVDELREADLDNCDRYSVLMQRLKEVPCLVLDDFSKERMTKAGAHYLYQIIDHRYRRELQTVITTNAKSVEELESREEYAQYITPMVSRVIERGAWVTISKTEDYRVKREVKRHA